MKVLSLCDPTQYKRPPLDVPTYYQRLASDPRVQLYHVPAPDVTQAQMSPPLIQAIASPSSLSYDEFVTLCDRPSQPISLEEIDLVFCRTLKPYAPTYLSQLSQWERFTQFVNRPTGKQRQMQADFLLNIAAPFMPETIVTSDYTEAHAFFEKHQIIVAKAANSTGGRGVFKIYYENGRYCVDNILTGLGTFSNFSEVMRCLQSGCVSGDCEALQLCRYLPNTLAGDKRVVVVDGEIYGSYLRKSKSGHWVNNVSADGTCSLCDIGADERKAIVSTAHYYQQMGLHTLGYDFLMDDDGTWRISEINAGNIGGFARLEMLTGQPVMDRLIDWMLAFAQRSFDNSVVDSALAGSGRTSTEPVASERVVETQAVETQAVETRAAETLPEKTQVSSKLSQDSQIAIAASR